MPQVVRSIAANRGRQVGRVSGRSSPIQAVSIWTEVPLPKRSTGPALLSIVPCRLILNGDHERVQWIDPAELLAES